MNARARDPELDKAINEEILSLSKEELLQLVSRLQKFLRTQEQTLEDIIDERDAARLLNELCHFDAPLLLEERQLEEWNRDQSI